MVKQGNTRTEGYYIGKTLFFSTYAKYAPAINKAVRFRDRTTYTRKNKHKGRESSPVFKLA